MSASEKLKELDAAYVDAHDFKAALRVARVLPQIVAVVEAAETLLLRDTMDMLLVARRETAVARALSALEEALS